MLIDNLSDLDRTYLVNQCEDQRSENDSLDFKRDMPGKGDHDAMREFLKDACALANLQGGDLVYGIADVDGRAEKVVPIPYASEAPDSAKRRLSQSLDSGIEPRLTGVKIEPVEVDGGYVLVVRIPSSFDGPYCVRNGVNRRFVMRNGTATADLTFDQLRGAFGRTATLAEKAQHLVNYCHQEIRQKRTPKVLATSPVCVVYLLPMAGLAGQKSVDLHRVFGDVSSSLQRHNWSGPSQAYNLDGLLLYGGQRAQGGYGYIQFFRNGSVESVELVGGESRNEPVVYARDLADFVRNEIRLVTDLLTKWSFGGPLAISVAILRTGGFGLASDDLRTFPSGRLVADRENLVAPTCWIESLEEFQLDATVRGLLDVLFQAYGLSACPYFDPATGAYKPPNR